MNIEVGCGDRTDKGDKVTNLGVREEGRCSGGTYEVGKEGDGGV